MASIEIGVVEGLPIEEKVAQQEDVIFVPAEELPDTLVAEATALRGTGPAFEQNDRTLVGEQGFCAAEHSKFCPFNVDLEEVYALMGVHEVVQTSQRHLIGIAGHTPSAGASELNPGLSRSS